MFFSGKDEAYHSSNTVLFLYYSGIPCQYWSIPSRRLQLQKKSVIFSIQRHSFGKHSNSKNHSNISIFNTEKQWGWRVYKMSGLGDHFSFFSSFKKLERCKIRVTLQCAVSEHTEFLSKQKKLFFFFQISKQRLSHCSKEKSSKNRLSLSLAFWDFHPPLHTHTQKKVLFLSGDLLLSIFSASKKSLTWQQ